MYQLTTINNQLSLIDESLPNCHPLSVDFLAGANAHRAQFGGGKNQPLSKACGLNKHKGLTIIDVTAGLGRDAYVLASLGASVIAIERNPTIAALLKDGLARAQAAGDENAARITLVEGNAAVIIPTLEAPDIIYCDPMYPHRDKSALVKKDMRLLRCVVGDDEDADHLFEIARQAAKRRVVVKRPRHAPTLSHQQPNYQLMGKSSRFDVFVR